MSSQYNESLRVSTDQVLESSSFALRAQHHFGDGWSANLGLSAGLVSHDQGTGDPAQRASGLGSLSLGAEYDFAGVWGLKGYNPSLRLGVDLGLPVGTEGNTGGAELDPNAAVPPTLVAIGNPAFDLGVRLTLTQFVHKMVAFAVPLSVKTPLTATPSGLNYGLSVGYGLTMLILPHELISLGVGVSGSYAGMTVSDTYGDLLNSGGHWLATEVSFGVRATDKLYVGIAGRIPVYAQVNGIQISETFSAMGLVSYAFGGKDDDEEEEKDPHDHHKKSVGGDFKDAASGGESFDLKAALVPGKITVIDFWAEWCGPCKKITVALKDLASRNDKLAVRRVEVPDFDTPVALEHMKGVSALPLLWIYGPDGERIEVMATTKVSEVVARLESLLKGL